MKQSIAERKKKLREDYQSRRRSVQHNSVSSNGIRRVHLRNPSGPPSLALKHDTPEKTGTANESDDYKIRVIDPVEEEDTQSLVTEDFSEDGS